MYVTGALVYGLGAYDPIIPIYAPLVTPLVKTMHYSTVVCIDVWASPGYINTIIIMFLLDHKYLQWQCTCYSYNIQSGNTTNYRLVIFHLVTLCIIMITATIIVNMLPIHTLSPMYYSNAA